MRYRTGFLALFAIAGAQACGGASTTDFSTPAGGKSAGGTGATGGSGGDATSTGGTKSSGGTSGTSGTGGDATGGSDSTGGTTATGGSDATGGTSGTGGDATGGTSGTGGDATGGSSGTTATGGTGGDATGGTSGSTATGGTGGDAAGGTAGMTGGTGGSAGSGMNPDCAALEMDYDTTLQQAEACNPQSGKGDQCTAMEKNSLTCPNCSVYVNPDNQAAIMHLDELRKQAGTHCVTPCPAIACVLPMGSMCAPVGGSRSAGRCTSQPATVP